MTSINYEPPSFDNQLNEPINVYFSFMIGRSSFRIEAFELDNNPSSEIYGKEKKVFALDNLPQEFKLEIEVNSLPIWKGKEAIKIAPGTCLGEAHHNELHIEQRNDETIYIFIVHYKNDGIPKNHVDPKVIHPDEA